MPLPTTGQRVIWLIKMTRLKVRPDRHSFAEQKARNSPAAGAGGQAQNPGRKKEGSNGVGETQIGAQATHAQTIPELRAVSFNATWYSRRI
jgi:hypothetical protein